MKTILIMGAGASEIPAIQKAKEMGLKVILVDRNEKAPGFKQPDIIKEVHSIADKEGVLKIAERHQVDGIVTFVDSGVRSVAYVAKRLHLPGLSEESAYMGTNKIAMRRRLQECGVPIPKFTVIRTREEMRKAVLEFEKKCVIKVPDSAGSNGIYLVKDTTDSKDIDYAFDYCMGATEAGELLIEELMIGPEICAETISSGGKVYVAQITDQLQKSPPYFTDCGYSQPSMLDDKIQGKIRQIAIDANLALGNVNGSSCTEMIVTEEGPKVVELGLRLAADFMTTKMVPLSTGINMAEAVIKIALGEHVEIKPTINKGSCVRYFIKERIGIIKDVVGIEEAKKIDGIDEVGILKGIGEEAKPLRRSADRLGYVITQGDSAMDAIKKAEKALDLIDFIVE